MSNDTASEGIEEAAAFEKKICSSIDGGFVMLGLALGRQLGLFDTLCKFDAFATSEEIAQACNCKER